VKRLANPKVGTLLATEVIMNPRPDLGQLGLSTGKKARLHRILHECGLRNGTALFLPTTRDSSMAPGTFSPTRPRATRSTFSPSKAASTAVPGQRPVEDAVRLAADAVGYTLYVGPPRKNATSPSTGRCARTHTGSACR